MAPAPLSDEIVRSSIAIMRNNIAGDLSVVATIDDIIAAHYG